MMMPDSERWDRHFLVLAACHAGMSKDPSTRVGAVVVGPDRELLSAGFNGFPRKIRDLNARLNDRETKLKLVVHAEMNAVLAAARRGVPMLGCTLYLVAMDKSGAIWGGPPCTRCTVEVIQAGIVQVVSYPKKSVPSKWHADLELSQSLLTEAGVGYREVEPA
jgi:dCMP deaminase